MRVCDKRHSRDETAVCVWVRGVSTGPPSLCLACLAVEAGRQVGGQLTSCELSWEAAWEAEVAWGVAHGRHIARTIIGHWTSM